MIEIIVWVIRQRVNTSDSQIMTKIDHRSDDHWAHTPYIWRLCQSPGYFNFVYLNGWTMDRQTENCFNDNKMQVSSEMIWEQ